MDLSPALTALVWVGAGLLALAGATKLRTPDGAMTALHGLGLPSGRVAARVLGLGEMAVAVGVLAVGGLAAAATSGVVYAALTAVAARSRSRQVACGCFGARRHPVPRLQVGVDAALAVAALLAAGLGLLGLPALPQALGDVAGDAGAVGVAAALVLVATAAGLIAAVVEHVGAAEGADLTRAELSRTAPAGAGA